MAKQPMRLSVHATIRQHYAALSRAERQLAELVLNFPGDLAGYSATELATIAEVSNAAVSRFVRRLGYANYDEMRRLARHEQEAGAPLYLLDHPSANSQETLVERHVQTVIANLQGTFSKDTAAVITSLAQAAATAGQIWITGFRHSRFIADYLRWSLAHARPGVRTFPGAGETIGELMIDIKAGDIVIVFALRRRVPSIDAVIGISGGIGAQIAIVTDAGMINTQRAKWVVRCKTKTRGPIDDHAATIAFAHILTEQVIRELAGASRRRLGEIDDLHSLMNELE